MNALFRVTMPLGALVLVASCGPPTPMPTDACKGRVAGDLVISELMLDPDGTDTGGEWVELFNTLGTPIDLRGYTITYRQGTSTAKSHTVRASVTIPSRGYLALGDVRSGPNPSWVGYSYGDDLGSFSQSSGTVGVRCGMTVLNEYTYTRSARSGRSRMLGGNADPDASRVANETNWCDTPTSTEYAPRNYGTPGGPNPQCAPEAMLGTCLQNGVPRPIVAAEAGDLIISEVMASPGVASDTVGEWFEVYATTDVDLNGVSIGTSTSRTTLNSMDCITAQANSYNLLARSADSFVNGLLPAPLVTFSLGLSGTNERLRLFRGDAGIDEAAFFASSSGVSWQLSPNLLIDPVRPEVNDQPQAFCKATGPWPDGGGDWGTPGAPNTTCPPDSGVFPDPDAGMPDAGPMPGPNECIDGTTMMIRALDRPAMGDLVLTEVMPDPQAVDDTVGEYFEVLVKRDVDLKGVSFGSEAWVLPAAHTASNGITLGGNACRRVTAGTYLVFARNNQASVNGGLSTVYETFSFGLSNSGALSRHVKAVSQGVELDRLAFPLTATATPGASIQLNAGLTDVTDNDNAANLSLTPTTSRYGGTALPDGGVTGGDRGTPGLANVPP
ncbi:MAG: lamin tail domain-containing protein [Myxococcaceae bacterium]|nr:lamin tail domain-containing protein [Myxococcaceae bacterium]